MKLVKIFFIRWMPLHKLLLVMALTVLSYSTGFSQVVLKAEAPSVVETNERFRLVFTVNARPSSFDPPDVVNFDILAGPTSSTMSSTSIVNGKRTEKFQVSYTYVLQAKKEGKFSISSASVVVDDKTYSSKSLEIEVVEGGGASLNDKSDTSSNVTDNDLFLRVSLNKHRVVVGEPVLATIKLYSNVSVAGFEDVRFPSFDGFWSQEIETPKNIEFSRENIDGKIYNAALIRRYMLLPQQSGALLVDGASMVCQVQLRDNPSTSRSIFDDFFDSYRTVRKRIDAPSVTVTANPLPSGAPASFGGAVGSYDIRGYLTRDSVDANEALSFIIEVSGTGNINLVSAPQPVFPSSFEVYDTKTSDDISRGSRGASGSKRFEYPLIARAPGEYLISPVEFSYYDINQQRYLTISTGELSVSVGSSAEGSLPADSGTYRGVARQAVKNITDDIRYIYTRTILQKRGNLFFAGTLNFYLLLIVLIVLFIIADRYLAKKVVQNRDTAGIRSRKANKVAKKRLKLAGTLLKGRDYSMFYEELHRALLGYASDKLNLSLADLSRDKIEESLREREVQEQFVGDMMYLIEQCEYARYAPDAAGSELEKHFSMAMDLISSMEL